MSLSPPTAKPAALSFFSSLVQQATLLVFFFCTLALGSMVLSTWLTVRVQGNAQAINQAGALRMQSYRLLATAPQSPEIPQRIEALEQGLNNSELHAIITREHLENHLKTVMAYWQNTLRQQFLNHEDRQRIATDVDDFVRKIDAMVVDLERKTEQHIRQIALLQKIFIVTTLLFLIAAIMHLRYRIVVPLQKLLNLASAITRRDFSQRVDLRHQDELNLLAQTLNTAAADLGQSYHSLEVRIAQKTDALQRQNKALVFLYETQRRLHQHHLHDNRPLHERIAATLEHLPGLLPFTEVRFRRAEKPLASDADISQTAQFTSHVIESEEGSSRTLMRWALVDEQQTYGDLEGLQETPISLDDDQHRLMATLVDTFTVALTLERQRHQRDQWLLTEERTAIARELHDSIAQSLSYLKLRLAYLQMHSTLPPGELTQCLTEMREEVNVAYRQLRELLTTFRLQLDQPGLYAALSAAVGEFTPKLGFQISLDYQLNTLLPADKTIHLLQITREALHNIYKHAQATSASLSVINESDTIVLRITDNGRGLPGENEKRNHYGLTIMHDRAQSLGGQCQIRNRPQGGVEVRVTFPLSSPHTTAYGSAHE